MEGNGGEARVTVIMGTRAQVIKMAPVLLELERQAVEYRLVLTGQHRDTVAELLEEFGVRTGGRLLVDRPDVKGRGEAVTWLARVVWRLWRSRKGWAGTRSGPAEVLVHGDTFSTLVGAVVARLAGARVLHVEAGLRSHDWRNPFPEELVRVAVSRLAHVGYCPGEWACGNLRSRKLRVVDTGANTILDSLRLAVGRTSVPDGAERAGPAVVSIHRFENLYSGERLARILSTVEAISERFPVLMVLHPSTRKRLEQTGDLEVLESNPRVSLRARMTYLPFMRHLAEAALVVTDGGSNQEELSYLGVPTLLMRTATERREGLGDNVVLDGLDARVSERFVETVAEGGHRGSAKLDSECCPSEVIVADILRRLEQGD
ncbi:UDP-N-acetylglucosamine 2-epimerase [Thioalkalivibrio sp. ALE19]|uniref:UDP-N-acetylglucosamine 2-epimerase n=1 Tax=Thioalkalivibrio sp. ALE19 TaxID=1266909 RepID=UPI0004167995|nr:UDP-N-acetylglucosamine 2-epimerase [Thioalkalivibrio sp. ALE19]